MCVPLYDVRIVLLHGINALTFIFCLLFIQSGHITRNALIGSTLPCAPVSTFTYMLASQIA